jgi:hypothetical protein
MDGANGTGGSPISPQGANIVDATPDARQPSRTPSPADVAVLGPAAADAESLVAKFAPVYLIFPEGKPGDPPPHPKGNRDYHPRVVEHFLDDARLVTTRRWVFALWIVPYAILILAGLAGALGVYDLTFGRLFRPDPGLETPILIALLVLPYLAIAFVTGKSAKGTEPVRRHLEASLDTGLANGRLRLEGGLISAYVWPLISPALRFVAPVVLTLLPQSAGSLVWKAYCDKIDATKKYPLTIYAHVPTEANPPGSVIEYWAFYYFNDWENQHTADWECVQLFFGDDCDEPIAAAYSNHLGCIWRPWSKVKKLVDADGHKTGHPLVFVARGSHAQYFEAKEIGYEPPFAITLPTLPGRMRGRFVGTRGGNIGRQRDHVVQVYSDVSVGQVSEHYQIRRAPDQLKAVDPFIPGQADWNAWWWLQFRGKWAEGLQSIQGPAAQTRRWTDSYVWVQAEGQADDSWDNLFTPETSAARAEAKARNAARAQEAISAGDTAGGVGLTT